jgi:hypothetical protein
MAFTLSNFSPRAVSSIVPPGARGRIHTANRCLCRFRQHKRVWFWALFLALRQNQAASARIFRIGKGLFFHVILSFSRA